MRFGIMAMQLEKLLPPGLPAEQVMAHLAGFDHAKLVRSLAEQGFRLVELGGDLSIFLPQTFMPAAIQRLLELKQELGLKYTVHLPLWSTEPSTPSAPVREGSVKAIIEIIQATQPLDPEIYVLHATGALAAEFYRMHLPESARALILRLFQGNTRQSLQIILAQTGLPSRRIAIETIEFPFELTFALAEELDLSICFDTGHVMAGFPGSLDFFETLERCLPRLGEIHLHDCPLIKPGEPPGYGLDHQALGKGDLDTRQLLVRLEQASFTGPVVFELTVPEALASLAEIRRLYPKIIQK